MPRKAFLQDLSDAAKAANVPYIVDFIPGADGEFHFTFQDNYASARITVLVTDPADYPREHACLIYGSDDTPQTVADAIEKAPSLSGKTVQQILRLLSNHLAIATGSTTTDSSRRSPALTDIDGDTDMPDSELAYGSDEDLLEEADDDDAYGVDAEVDDDLFDGPQSTLNKWKQDHESSALMTPSTNIECLSRLSRDVQIAKAAGFKVGHVGVPGEGRTAYLSIACRVTKLGISEEAMSAWQIEPSDYLVLLLQLPSHYHSVEDILKLGAKARDKVQFRVVLGKSYRPKNEEEASFIFSDGSVARDAPIDGKSSTDVTLRDCFISRPLDALLNERFFLILNWRVSHDFSWQGAERFFNESQGMSLTGPESVTDPEYYLDESNPALPDLVNADHISDNNKSSDQLSLALIAMQFTLRHFVNCVDFCLVCHNKLETKLEAIKPYVCDNPLCLYQYMNLGFGPSVEQEVVYDSEVVDLLVSFCYSGAKVDRLREYPDGLALLVPEYSLDPQIPSISMGYSTMAQARALASVQPKQRKWEELKEKVEFDRDSMELIYRKDQKLPSSVRIGEWVTVVHAGQKKDAIWDCRVIRIDFDTIKLSSPVPCKTVDVSYARSLSLSDQMMPDKDTEPTGRTPDAQVYFYRGNFDTMSGWKKSEAIAHLLDTLPSVREMRDYLTSRRGQTLSQWKDRISPAALSILRWIIASNRSCIVQVDQPLDVSETGQKIYGVNRKEQRIPGFDGWMQFRFAMGAPDKEKRFVDAITTCSDNPEYPTLFAWHGSSLSNWHSIIRQGLDFSETLNGRAFGHGCYHAKDFNTSVGYSGQLYAYSTHNYTPIWPSSELRVTSAMALSEIVNSPNNFTSKDPHFVVAQTDWIQTRYLFVQVAANIKFSDAVWDVENAAFPQDPDYTPRGLLQKPLVLPLTAVPESRRPIAKEVYGGSFSVNKASKTCNNDDTESVKTLEDDTDFLVDDPSRPPSPPPTSQALSCVPFTPRPMTGLPLMVPPTYATSQATRRLQKDFKTLLDVQDHAIRKGTLHELGWYADPNVIEGSNNLYQWIVNLHSFPRDLPLGEDMLKLEIDSVVMEFRFHHTYPISPPFIRVIRPRFLNFNQGGGGHITAGGSICMDLLTNSGWSAVSSIESVLLQIRMAVMSTDPRPARLVMGGGHSGAVSNAYGVGEAVEAYRRACLAHGWQIPDSLKDVSSMVRAT